MCSVSSRLGQSCKLASCAMGSTSNTSSTALPKWPALSEAATAATSTICPRDVLISTAPFFMPAMRCALKRPRVPSISGTCRVKPKLYNPRHPERTLLYQTVAGHYESWLELASAGQFDGQGDCRTPKPYVRTAFRKYLECGIFAHGFARARCADCAHDYFVAFSCKGRGACPSCNTPAVHL
jgi:Transposase zinc-binding domain